MTNTKDIILKLKEVRNEKGLSYNDILELMEKNGDFLSKSTISRVFADGSEDLSFRYEETIRPIAKALLDIENIGDDDDMDIKVMKSQLKYKMQRIEDLEHQIEQLQSDLKSEKIEYHERMDTEREQWSKSIEFLKNQISLKDKRMDFLLDTVQKRDSSIDDLLKVVLSCPCRIKAEREANKDMP